MTAEGEEALELVEEIIGLIEESVPDWAKEKSSDFFESIKEKTKSIGESVEQYQNATEGQLQALRNMLSGVKKWVKD